MSRLFDRILAHGCRRAATADFHDLVDRVTAERDWGDFAHGLSKILIEEGTIESPLDAAQAKALHEAENVRSRSRVAGEVFSTEALERSVVICGDDVAAYIHSLGATNLGDVCGIVAPPFEWFWIECRAPNRFSVHSWGVLVHGLEMPADKAQDAERWLLRATLIFETNKGDPWGPVATYRIPVAPDGHLWPSDADGRGSVFGLVSSCAGDDADNALWADELPGYLFSALLSVSFMHCKNVDIIDTAPPTALSKKHMRIYGRPLTRFKTLNIDPMRRVLDRDGHAEMFGLRNAVHICRGHFKTFSPEAPLFGKLTGTYWWADHVRGDTDRGSIDKDYKINIAADGVGRAYVEADETLSSSPQQVGSNPDLSGRGRVAHACTQNLLAATLVNAGLTPLSPRPEDPQFDLAWTTADEIWVCEVKSLTQQNEMSQMHTAIGQVIDYAHRLVDERPIRTMIAVEAQPVLDHWVSECASHDILLVWPEGFAAAFT